MRARRARPAALQVPSWEPPVVLVEQPLQLALVRAPVRAPQQAAGFDQRPRVRRHRHDRVLQQLLLLKIDTAPPTPGRLVGVLGVRVDALKVQRQEANAGGVQVPALHELEDRVGERIDVGLDEVVNRVQLGVRRPDLRRLCDRGLAVPMCP